MKPTEQQIIELKTLVSDMVDYHETYQELYDHILTALEKKDKDIELLDAVDAIVDEDFGGYERLFKTEDERQKIVSRQIIKQQRHNFISYLKPPLVISTIAIGVFFYFATNSFFTFIELITILRVIALIPLLIPVAHALFIRYLTGKEKPKSIKDKQIQWLGYASALIMELVIRVPGWFVDHDGLINLVKLHSTVIAVLFTVYVVYVRSISKLYRQEFKMQLTQ